MVMDNETLLFHIHEYLLSIKSTLTVITAVAIRYTHGKYRYDNPLPRFFGHNLYR